MVVVVLLEGGIKAVGQRWSHRNSRDRERMPNVGTPLRALLAVVHSSSNEIACGWFCAVRTVWCWLGWEIGRW
jgi:hypothetical protein